MPQLPALVRGRARSVAVVAAVAAAVVLTMSDSSSADVTAVQGGAYGYTANVSLFGGPYQSRGPDPVVTLPASGGNVTANAASGLVQYGPATFWSSGPIAVASQGTLGPTGSVTSTTSITTINTSQQEVFTATSASSTCTADESGVSGSTTITDGVLVLSDPNPDTSGEAGESIVNVPTNPDPNTSYSGTISGVNDNFQYIFNEQIVNPDGSLTVYAGHMVLVGPTAVGDVYWGQTSCGVTGNGTTPSSSSSSTSSTSTTSTTLAGLTCNGRAATITGTTGPDVLTGTNGVDVIVSDAGDDVIYGLGGDDHICAGDGDDAVRAGIGNDFVFGGEDDDQISGSAGNDRLLGGPGRDQLLGGLDNDTLDGGPDADQCIGEGGANTRTRCEA